VPGIGWEQLRELAAFRAENGCAVSLYVNLDPSEAPTPAAIETRLNSQLAEAERLAAVRKASTSYAQREGLKADLERIRRWFDDDFDRRGVRGVAVFAASLDNFWSTLALPSTVPDAVKIATELYRAPLALHVGRDSGLVAVVGRERGRVYKLRGTALVEVADESQEVPGRHDQGGLSQARFASAKKRCSSAGARRPASTVARPPVGSRRSKLPRMDVSSCSSSRTASTNRCMSARTAGGRRRRTAAVRSTARRW
jgi:peptide subunit release factor 1 (eRF1)